MGIKRTLLLLSFISILALFSSCKDQKGKQLILERPVCNSIYYWKTRFTLDDYEQSFLKTHDIHRMYVKYFDVDDDAPSPYLKTIICRFF